MLSGHGHIDKAGPVWQLTHPHRPTQKLAILHMAPAASNRTVLNQLSPQDKLRLHFRTNATPVHGHFVESAPSGAHTPCYDDRYVMANKAGHVFSHGWCDENGKNVSGNQCGIAHVGGNATMNLNINIWTRGS